MKHTTVIRILSVLVGVALAACSATPLTAPAFASSTVPEFRFVGTGWGHGVGMSQWGAYGFALSGRTYGEILRHYYTGTSIGTVSQKTVQVNLDRAASSSNSGFTRERWRLRPGWQGGSLVVGGQSYADATYTFVASGNSVVLRNAAGTTLRTFSGSVDVRSTGSGSPALTQIVDGSGPFGHTYVRYRGTLRISASNGRLKLLNRLGMEDYLRGVVPREMPSGWHMEALKAQATAARSYAYVDGSELYCTTSSQVYNGHSKGSDRTRTEWHETTRTNQAIDATAHRVVRYGSNVVKTYFFSQSGGHTANSEDVWSAALPYLRGVRDPHEAKAGAPHVPWSEAEQAGLVWNGSTLAGTLRSRHGSAVPASPAYVDHVWVDRAASGHVRRITYRFSNGSTFTRTGSQTRTDLGLRSSFFRVACFPIERVSGSDRYGTAVAVSQASFPQGGRGTPVVLASGQDYADALVGSAVAGAVNGSLLLTRSSTLPASIGTEIARLSPTAVYVIGGEAAIGQSVVRQVTDKAPGAAVRRIGGVDRYETSLLAARFVRETASPVRAIIVSGNAWADAASASALAYARAYPVVFSRKSTLGAHAETYLAEARPQRMLVIGGTGVIEMGVEEEIRALTGREDIRRLAGSNRYATSAVVARYSVWPEGFSKHTVNLATGQQYADALTGGVLAGASGYPLVLTRGDRLDPGTASFLNASDVRPDIEFVRVFGGYNAVNWAVKDGVDALLTR